MTPVSETPADAAAPAIRPLAAWSAWGVALVAYVMAIFHRSSLGVAGLMAQHRFHAGAAMLSMFSVLQLGVYAAMQVPVGVLVDRFGSRRMISTGAFVMAGGTYLLAGAHSLGLAILARVLIGGGDACTWVSLLRIVGAWFPARRIPVLTQLTGNIGALGQIAATYPLLSLLHGPGWGVAFTVGGSLSIVAGVATLVAVRDRPPGRERPPVDGHVVAHLRQSWSERGTRLGLWTHFVTLFPSMAFVLIWGYPFLVKGEGISSGTASLLLTAMVPVSVLFGPLLGRVVAGWPMRRSSVVLAIVGVTVASWTLVLVWPGRAPLGLLAVLVGVLALNGPVSSVGFDFARTFNPEGRVGSASGIVNVGGFVASLATILAIGVVLDIRTPGASTDYTLASFRWAFSVQYVVWAIGSYGVWRHRRYLRQVAASASGGVTLDPLPAAVLRKWRGRRA